MHSESDTGLDRRLSRVLTTGEARSRARPDGRSRMADRVSSEMDLIRQTGAASR